MNNILTGSTALAIENTVLRTRIAQLEADAKETDGEFATLSNNLGNALLRIEQLEAALQEILSNSCDAFYEMANMLDDEDFSGEVPGRSGTLIGHREEYHKYMVEALTKAGDAAREALTAMEQRT